MDIKLKSNRVTRDVPDLSDYTKISIPWDSSGNDKLYVYMKPDEHSQKVYIGSDENKGKERSKSLTFSTIKSGVNTGTQSKATLNVIQEKAVYTYRLIISVQGGASNTIPASGGSIQLQTILETYIGDRLENSALVNSTYVNTSSGEGSYFTVSSKGLVTGVNRGTTVGNKRSIIVKATYTSGLINVTDSLAIYLEANSASYGNVSLTVTSPVNLDATGGTYTINPTASQTVSYTSGSTKNNTAANGGISLSYTQVSSSSGFSLSGNKVTYTNNNTTSSSRSYQVNVIATGEGSKTNTKTITFTQSAGQKIYSNPVISIFEYVNEAGVTGGKIKPTIYVTQKYKYNNTGTEYTVSWETDDLVASDFSSVRIVSPVTGLSVDNMANVTWASNTGNDSSRSGTIAIKVTLNGKTSAEVTATTTQSAGQKIYSNPVISIFEYVNEAGVTGGKIKPTIYVTQKYKYNNTGTEYTVSWETDDLVASDFSSVRIVSPVTGLSVDNMANVTWASNTGNDSSRSGTIAIKVTLNGKTSAEVTATTTQSADSIISTTYSNDIVGFGGDGRFSGVSVALYNNQQINSQYVLPASAVTTSNPIKIMADNPAVVQKTVTYSSGYKEESLVPASEAYPGKIVYIKIGLVESSNGRVSRTEIVTNSHTTNLFNDGIRITYNSYGTTNINQYKANVILGVSIVSATEAANRYNTNKTNFVNFNKYTLLLSGNKVESYDLSTNTVSYVGYKKTSSGSIFTDKTNYPDGLDYGGYFIYDVTVKGSEVYTSGSTVVKGKAVIPTLSSKLPSDNVGSTWYPIDALENPEILSQQGDVSNGNSVTRISIHVVRLNDKTSSEQVYLQFGVGGEYGSNNALAEFRVIKSRKAIVVGSIGRTEGSINLITPNGITSISIGFTFTITDSSGQVDGTTLTGDTTWPSVQQMGLEFLLKNSNHKSNLINLLKDVLRSYGNYAVIRSSSSSLPQFNGTKWTLTQDEKSELWRILLVRSSVGVGFGIDYDR